MDSLCHPWVTTTNLSYRFPIFETFATALCGTTGTHRRFHTQRLLQTETFTHRSERVAPDASKSQFYLSFWRSNLISCQRVAADTSKSQFYSVCDVQRPFRAKGLQRTLSKSQFLPQFLTFNVHFVRKGCVWCRLVSTAPRVKREIEKKEGARGQESQRAREQEGKRECEDMKIWGCEDEKMWRWEDVKMRRWADVKMRRCEDVKMSRCEDVKMWCEDEKMWRWGCEDLRMWGWEDVKIWRCYVKIWRCENVWQTPTIRRTLRSDALGKNEAILRDFLQKWKVECRADGLVPMRFAIFHSTFLKYCACHGQWSQVIRSAAPVTQHHATSSQQTWRSDAPKCNPSQASQALIWPMRLLKCLPPEKHLCRSSSKVPRLPTFLELARCRIPCACHATVRTRQFFTCLPSKCASRHNGVHFFNMSTSKSSQRMVCFVHFYFNMCFAPQWRALFRHVNFQKCSNCWCVLYIFTSACTFSTSQLRKVVRDRQFLTLLTSKCASCHNGVQFFISHLARWLRTRRFSEPTFRPSWATNHWKKHNVSRLSYLFAHLDRLSSETFSFLIFFLLLFSSLTLPTSAFHLSILSEVWLLNFLRTFHFSPMYVHTEGFLRY